MRAVFVYAALLALGSGASFVSPALGQQMVTNATPLGASDPLRQKTESFANLIFQGHLAEAAAVLKGSTAQAAPHSEAAPGFDEQIEGLRETFGSGGYTATRFIKAGEGQVLVYGSKPDGGRAGLLILLDATDPHRIREVMQVQIGNGRAR